jgi:ABC-type transport system involved in cytochrome c biogenesis permease subunit
MKKIIINISVVLFCLWFIQRGVKPTATDPTTAVNLHRFSQLPVKYEGRIKPMDTLARNLLTILSDKQTVRTDEGAKITAIQWLLDSMSGRPKAEHYKIFRIENLDVLSSLELDERRGFRYSYAEIAPSIHKLDRTARAAYQKDEHQRDLFDKQIIKTANKVYLYRNTLSALENPTGLSASQLSSKANYYKQLEKQTIPLIIPPTGQDAGWQPLMSSLLYRHKVQSSPVADAYGNLLKSHRSNDAKVFNKTLIELENLIAKAPSCSPAKLRFEAFYNRLDAFMKSAQLYVLVFLLSCFGWLSRKNGLIQAALTMMICAFLPHTVAIIARIFLSGYPPVTNLYSSAIFIGWGAVATGIILELAYRKADGMGNLAGSISGFCTLLIAHYLAGDGDTMTMMRAVLDTRFWLTTHVIGVFYIVAGLATRRLDKQTDDNLYRMMYGTICFALLLSFVGTVLGGLWADDSWGRFWGWDPKENGALLIVIWNAIMLHARYGGMVKNRGFAVMAVFGNIVTAWSWFGVNQLSVGLHSYGFTQSATFWLMIFGLSQLIACLVGLIPQKYWRSNKNDIQLPH